MFISKKNTLICLMVLAVVSLEIGCGPQGHKARQRIGGGLPADKAKKPADGTNPDTTDTTKDKTGKTVVNRSEKIKAHDAALATLNKGTALKRSSKELLAGDYTLSEVTTFVHYMDTAIVDMDYSTLHETKVSGNDLVEVSTDVGGTNIDGPFTQKLDIAKSFTIKKGGTLGAWAAGRESGTNVTLISTAENQTLTDKLDAEDKSLSISVLGMLASADSGWNIEDDKKSKVTLALLKSEDDQKYRIIVTIEEKSAKTTEHFVRNIVLDYDGPKAEAAGTPTAPAPKAAAETPAE